MRVLVVTERFGETLSAPLVGDAIVAGWQAESPSDTVTSIAMSDGGAGFLQSVHRELGGEFEPVVIAGPHDRSEPQSILHTFDRAGQAITVLEFSEATASWCRSDDPLAGNSAAIGELLQRALEHGSNRIILGLGEFGPMDGGSGLLGQLLGASEKELSDKLRSGGNILAELTSLDLSPLVRLCDFSMRRVEIATALTAPLLGLSGLAASASRDRVIESHRAQDLERDMGAWAQAIISVFGDEIRSEVSADLLARGLDDGQLRRRICAEPGLAAAGGAAFALRLLGSRVISGAQLVASLLGLGAAVASQDVVVVAQQELTELTAPSAVLAEVGQAALANAVPIVMLSVSSQVNRRRLASLGVTAAYDLRNMTGLINDEDRGELADCLSAASTRIARTWSRS